jgi:hypothetical protein
VGISRDYPLKTQTSKQPTGEIPGYELIPSHPLKYPRSKQGLRGDEVVPGSPRTRGTVSGEVTDAGVLGWLGARTPNPRPPGVRRNDFHQDAVERDRGEPDKVSGVLGKAQQCLEDADGEVAWT